MTRPGSRLLESLEHETRGHTLTCGLSGLALVSAKSACTKRRVALRSESRELPGMPFCFLQKGGSLSVQYAKQ